MNLVELLDATAARQPEHPAIIGPADDENLSYAQFRTWVDETAELLSGHGVRKGHCVGLHCPSGRNYICLTYAIWRLGACVVPIPTELSAEEKMRVCEGIALDYILSDRGGKGKLSPAFAEPSQGVDDFIWIAPAKRFRDRPAGFDEVNAAFS